MLQDLRHALRGFARHPAFSLTAILAASLGIGATTAVFSVVDPILFRPLPYSHEDRLLSVGMKAPLDANEFMFASEYFDLRRSPGPFEAVTAFQAGSIACDLTERDNPLRLRCLRLEANFLQTLGQPLLLGRTFSPEEDRPGGPPVAMISYGLWTTRFNRDPKVIGRTLALDGAPAVITGVLPEELRSADLGQDRRSAAACAERSHRTPGQGTARVRTCCGPESPRPRPPPSCSRIFNGRSKRCLRNSAKRSPSRLAP